MTRKGPGMTRKGPGKAPHAVAPPRPSAQSPANCRRRQSRDMTTTKRPVAAAGTAAPRWRSKHGQAVRGQRSDKLSRAMPRQALLREFWIFFVLNLFSWSRSDKLSRAMPGQATQSHLRTREAVLATIAARAPLLCPLRVASIRETRKAGLTRSCTDPTGSAPAPSASPSRRRAPPAPPSPAAPPRPAPPPPRPPTRPPPTQERRA